MLLKRRLGQASDSEGDGEFFPGALRDDLGVGVRRNTSGQDTTDCGGTELVQKCKEVGVASQGQGGGGGGEEELNADSHS